MVSITQLLKDSEGKYTSQDEIKRIFGKKGEERTFYIPIVPGKLQQLTPDGRKDKSVFFFFSLLYGDARFFDFSLRIN